MPRKICPKCKSHNVTILSTEVVCNICDTTVDFVIENNNIAAAKTWAYDYQPCNILAEARLYNMQYHRKQAVTGICVRKV